MIRQLWCMMRCSCEACPDLLSIMEPVLHFFCGCLCFIIWIVPLWSESLDFTSFGKNAITSIFAKGWDSLGFSKKNGEKKCEHWSENEFTSFGENAITSIFAKGWDSLGFSKKMVKETAKIGQKMNSLLLAKMPSLWFSPGDGIHSDFRKKWWTKMRKLVRNWIHFFWRKCHHFNFRPGMGFTTIFEKNGEKKRENWSENEFCILPHLKLLQEPPELHKWAAGAGQLLLEQGQCQLHQLH